MLEFCLLHTRCKDFQKDINKTVQFTIKMNHLITIKYMQHYMCENYTPNANMADRSVGARDESNESEASQALMFCFDNAFPEKSCFVVDLVPLFRPPSAFLCS